MRLYLLMALLSLAPGEVEVRAGESLDQVAERALGDRDRASELKALNKLQGDTLVPGMKLKLPGADRDKAQMALESARNSVAQSDPKSPQHEEALAKLKEAESHFQSARYAEAAQTADDAWKRLAERPAQPTRLSVVVNDRGDTVVKAVSGRVSVEGGGTTQVIEDGASVQVEKGQAPRVVLGVPRPTQPEDKKRLSVKPIKSGLQPVLISWKAVQGAESYEVELVPDQGERRVMPASSNELKVPLAAGSYRWSVRALSRGSRSEASAEQGFEVAEPPAKPLRVKVKSSKWK
ncbi:LysM peptidoglycan-binding domain-containing protein [Cystobacter fuscus]|uniref:LysM peptidoglycan-binding domain-containing protein n=1 Tax=Cystobacter fuscus TaxID=43 RepID=UPI002B323610|nr:LysM peptidoglycan-binding domain-containing protein [Cystobacter fuscus]